MTAEDGPGPSSMASSPVVPSTARKLRIKRRVVNLVNPADFSEQSMSPSSSMTMSAVVETEISSSAWPIPEITHTFTPQGISETGVRGILRPSGTPGSGNGVRFLPKNRFRIITPNQSLHTPKPPSSPSSTSFLSQLLAVTIPSMSPRKLPTPAEKPDESWEVPGHEGEISLVASSAGSLLDASRNEEEEGPELETVPWTGIPETHSSPLALPAIPDLSASQDFELPSTDFRIPEDVSNLLSQRFSPPAEIDSFSISELTRPISRPSLIPTNVEEYREEDSSSRSSTTRLRLDDSNPTIRRPLMPLRSEQVELELGTPTPANRPYTSIFADMSAEQADLSWPLTRSIPDGGEVYHSAVLDNGEVTPTPNTQSALTPECIANSTQFYDCSNTFLSPTLPSSSSLSTSLVSRSSPVPLDLLQPSKALFEAHSAHTSALTSELALYRSLAEKLHAEVAERDSMLAELNVKALEGEEWRVKAEELELELRTTKSVFQPVAFIRRSSADDVVDRTTVLQAETRDLEIRLAKSLADQEELVRRFDQEQAEKEHQVRFLEEARRSLALAQERERDVQVRDEVWKTQVIQTDSLRDELEDARRLEMDLRVQLDEAARRTTELEIEVDELGEGRRANEEEIARLAEEVGILKKERITEEEELRTRVAELEKGIEVERKQCSDAERRAEEEIRRSLRLETANRELSKSLQSTRAELGYAETSNAREKDGEIQRLRSESASKDLEIMNLQRRKIELKEDREMLNIALDSKQQEVELVKRKFAVRGVAGSTPLGESRRSNVDGGINTPAPNKGLKGSVRGKSSMAYITPVEGVRTLKGGHGVVLSQSTAKTARVMRRVDEEVRPPVGSLRRERMLA